MEKAHIMLAVIARTSRAIQFAWAWITRTGRVMTVNKYPDRRRG